MNKEKIIILVIALSALVTIVHCATANTDGVETVDGSGNITACLQGF